MSVPWAHVLLQQRRARCLSIPPSQHCVRKGRESLGEWCVSCASSASIQAFDAQLWPGFVKGGLCSVYLRGSSLLGNSSLYCQTHGSPSIWGGAHCMGKFTLLSDTRFARSALKHAKPIPTVYLEGFTDRHIHQQTCTQAMSNIYVEHALFIWGTFPPPKFKNSFLVYRYARQTNW
jgi:hypothetical protein